MSLSAQGLMAPSAISSSYAAVNAAVGSVSKPTHRYTTEISQMAFVFNGESSREIDEDVCQYIEDIVRGQLSDIVLQVRTLGARRGNRTLSVEDLIFVIRHDRSKVNRLRTYLSWKDVRKKVKDSEADEELDNMEEPASDRAAKALRNHVKVPWELNEMFGDFLPEEADGADEDEVEAYEDSKKRLKELDDITRDMTKEQYMHYSECRAASFTYRKSKKFREFVNAGNTVEGVLNDEVMDSLGFLAYEMVRTLCEAGTANKKRVTLARASIAMSLLKQEKEREEAETAENDPAGEKDGADSSGPGTKSRKRKGTLDEKEGSINSSGGGGKRSGGSPAAGANGDAASTGPPPAAAKRGRKSTLSSEVTVSTPRSPPARPLTIPTSLFSDASAVTPMTSTAPTPRGGDPNSAEAIAEGVIDEVFGARERSALRLEDVNAGYVAMQHGQASLKAFGMRKWRGGVSRISTRLV